MSNPIAAISDHPLKGQTFTPRWGLAAAHLNGKVYIFGGYLWFHGVEGFFNDLYELDLSSSVIRRVFTESPAPSPRFGHSLVADPTRNQLVLFGGRNSVESFNDVWIFSASKQAWQLIHNNRGASGSVSGGEKHSTSFISRASTANSSGHATPASPSGGEEGSGSSRKGEKKSKRADGTTKDALKTEGFPQPRSWHAACFYRNAIYVYGGWDHCNTVFNDLWCFDLPTRQWTRIEPAETMHKPPHGRSCHQAGVWGDCFYIFGGLRDGDAAIGDMWRFSFETSVWSPVESCGARPVGRTSAAGVIVGDSWILHGGLNDYPRAGMSSISDIIEFNFPTATWSHRGVLLSDGVTPSARRYGHVAVATPASSSIILLGGAEKYATACQNPSCRLDLLPSQGQVMEMQHEVYATKRTAQMNRDRVGELIELVTPYEAQIRQLKADNSALLDRCQTLQSQVTSMHQQQAALQSSCQQLQQSLAAVEQFIPMMRSVGAAIANFGSVAGGWSAPSSTGSLPGALGSAVQSSGNLGAQR